MWSTNPIDEEDTEGTTVSKTVQFNNLLFTGMETRGKTGKKGT